MAPKTAQVAPKRHKFLKDGPVFLPTCFHDRSRTAPGHQFGRFWKGCGWILKVFLYYLLLNLYFWEDEFWMNCENVAISHNRQEPTQNKTKQPTQNKQIARLPWLSISKLFQHYINKCSKHLSTQRKHGQTALRLTLPRNITFPTIQVNHFLKLSPSPSRAAEHPAIFLKRLLYWQVS